MPFLERTEVKTRVLFVTSANEGPEMKANIETLISAVRTRKDASLRSDSATYPQENHDSTVIKGYLGRAPNSV